MVTGKELHHARSCYLNPCKLGNKDINYEKDTTDRIVFSQVLAHTLFSVPVDRTVRNQEYRSAPYQKACCKASKETEQFSYESQLQQ